MNYLKKEKDANGRVRFCYDDIKGNYFYTTTFVDSMRLNLFFEHEGVRYYFKANGTYSFDTNELLCDVLAKAMGLPTVDLVPCSFFYHNGKEYRGILSKDYLKSRKTDEMVTIHQIFEGMDTDCSVETILSLLKSFVNKRNRTRFNHIVIDPNLENDLKKLCLFHYLTGQQDNDRRNIEFVIERNKKQAVLRLAPFVDNSLTFYRTFKDVVPDETIYKDSRFAMKYLDFSFRLKSKIVTYNQKENVERDFVEEFCSNHEFKQFFEQARTIDFAREINQFLKDNPRLHLTPQETRRAITYFNSGIATLNELFASHAQKNAPKHNVQHEATL